MKTANRSNRGKQEGGTYLSIRLANAITILVIRATTQILCLSASYCETFEIEDAQKDGSEAWLGSTAEH